MIRFTAAALAAVLLAGTAHAAELTPTDIVNRHIAAAAKGDADAIVADYADDAVVLQAGQAAQGKAEIRALFDRLFPKRAPGAAAPAGALGPMTVERVWQEGNVGFVSWHMGPVKGTDEFLVRNGKIAIQAVFIAGPPPAAAAPSK